MRRPCSIHGEMLSTNFSSICCFYLWRWSIRLLPYNFTVHHQYLCAIFNLFCAWPGYGCLIFFIFLLLRISTEFLLTTIAVEYWACWLSMVQYNRDVDYWACWLSRTAWYIELCWIRSKFRTHYVQLCSYAFQKTRQIVFLWVTGVKICVVYWLMSSTFWV